LASTLTAAIDKRIASSSTAAGYDRHFAFQPPCHGNSFDLRELRCDTENPNSLVML